jgi:hypothetical protein
VPTNLPLSSQRIVSSFQVKYKSCSLICQSKFICQVIIIPDPFRRERTEANVCKSDAGTSVLQDQTCNGGFQAYCCLGFVASSTANTGSLDLVDQSSTKRDLQRRGSVSPGVRAVCLTVAEIAIEAAVALAAAVSSLSATPSHTFVYFSIPSLLKRTC